MGTRTWGRVWPQAQLHLHPFARVRSQRERERKRGEGVETRVRVHAFVCVCKLAATTEGDNSLELAKDEVEEGCYRGCCQWKSKRWRKRDGESIRNVLSCMFAINSNPTFPSTASSRCLCVIVKLHGSLTVVFHHLSPRLASGNPRFEYSHERE